MGPTRAVAGTDNVIETVNLTSDEADANTANSTCDTDLVAAGAQCTLRAAIQQANAYDGIDADLIRFDIPGGGVDRIAPLDFLPNITSPTIVDGYSQPGSSVNTQGLGRGDNAKVRIELSGKKLDPFNGSGLRFAPGSSGSAVRGLCINRFASGLVLDVPATISGNFIGTDATGMKDRGNTFDGIFTSGLLGTRFIGGSDPAARNVISANGRAAITSNMPTAIKGNYIGVASDGASPLGNRTNSDVDAAISLSAMGSGSLVGGPGNAANVVAFNRGKGIALDTVDNVAQLIRNRIFGNTGIGIDLGDDGRTLNDPGDADSGPNRLLNFPVLKKAVNHGRRTKIEGVLRTFPVAAPYGIEFFANPAGTRQAKRFIGFIHVDTNDNGKVKFKLKTKRAGVGAAITATTTDDGGATSELATPVEVRAPSQDSGSRNATGPR
jgi:hypothetical protein